MKMSRKIVALTSVIVIASFLLGTAVLAAAPEGNPLEELWEAIFGIQDDVEDLQTQIDLQAQIAELQSEIDVLKAQMEFLEDPWIVGPEGPQGEQGSQGETGPQGPLGGFGAPDFDSGWVPIDPAESKQIIHGLETTNVFVYLIGRNNFSGIHQWHYGGEKILAETIEGDQVMLSFGAHWEGLVDNQITVYRYYDDVWWEEFRLLIWVLP